MTRQEIREMAIDVGFTLRDQPDGSKDLNQYVYSFAEKVAEQARGGLAGLLGMESKFLATVTPTNEEGEPQAPIAMVADLTEFTREGHVEILLPGNGDGTEIYLRFNLSDFIARLSRFCVNT